MDMQIFLEWFHRLVALIMGMLLFGMGWKVFRSPFLRRTYQREILLAGGLFLGQCVLGGLTVLKLLKPSIVSSHLLTALLFFGLLLWIWRRSSSLATMTFVAPAASLPTLWGIILATALLYFQLGIGSMVSSNNAGLICPDFPKCHGMWLPSANFLAWVQMTHRYFAFLLFFLAIGFFWKTKNQKLPIATSVAIRLFPILLALQIFLGVLNIFYAMPLWGRAAHHANGIFMFANLLVGAVDLYFVGVRQRITLKFTTTAEDAVL